MQKDERRNKSLYKYGTEVCQWYEGKWVTYTEIVEADVRLFRPSVEMCINVLVCVYTHVYLCIPVYVHVCVS